MGGRDLRLIYFVYSALLPCLEKEGNSVLQNIPVPTYVCFQSLPVEATQHGLYNPYTSQLSQDGQGLFSPV